MARALVNKLTEESLCYEEDTLFLEFDPYDKYGDSCAVKRWIPSYVYAPYIIVADPFDGFNPNIQIVNRYSEKEIDEKFYGEIKF